MVNTTITVVARNIALKLAKNIKENTGEPVLEILHNIHQNIFEPQMLRAEFLSKIHTHQILFSQILARGNKSAAYKFALLRGRLNYPVLPHWS